LLTVTAVGFYAPTEVKRGPADGRRCEVAVSRAIYVEVGLDVQGEGCTDSFIPACSW